MFKAIARFLSICWLLVWGISHFSDSRPSDVGNRRNARSDVINRLIKGTFPDYLQESLPGPGSPKLSLFQRCLARMGRGSVLAQLAYLEHRTMQDRPSDDKIIDRLKRLSERDPVAFLRENEVSFQYANTPSGVRSYVAQLREELREMGYRPPKE